MLPWARPEMLRYYFELPAAAPSVNTLRKLHFHAYRWLRKVWRAKVLAALLEGGFRPSKQPALRRAALVVVRHSAGHLDWDNALGGLKPLQDCLVQASKRNPDGLGLVCDDNPVHMPYPPFMRQLKTGRGKGRTEVWIFELPGA